MSTIAAGTTLTTALVETGDTTGNLVIQTNGTTTAATFDTSQNLTVVNNVTATRVSVGIGSNTAPSITFTGDTNTGIYSPAADTIAFTEGGVEAMRIDSSGNVGIGTSSPTQRLDLFGTDCAIRVRDIGQTNGLLIKQNNSDGGNLIYAVNNNYLAFGTNNTERARITSGGDLQFNSGYGSVATAYGCRVWVNFNGTGTPAIRASGNVTSITDNGAGDFTVNFTTAMPDANYCVNVSAPMYTTSNGSVTAKVYGSGTVGLAGLQSTTQIRVCWTDILGTANFYDPANYYVSIFR